MQALEVLGDKYAGSGGPAPAGQLPTYCVLVDPYPIYLDI